jgi:hypothetical protein
MADNMVTVEQLAAEPIEPADLELLDRIAVLHAALDPVPDGLIERLQFGITLDALHAEIAQLQRVDDLAGARGAEATEVQTITFTSSQLTTMVTISPIAAGRVRIDGWAAPGGGLDVELRIVGGQLQTRADADGRFVFEDVPKGLAQFVLRSPEGSAQAPVITPSIDL